MRRSLRRSPSLQRLCPTLVPLLIAAAACAPAAPSSGEAKAPEAAAARPAAAPLAARAPGEPETLLPVEADDARLGSERARVTVVAFLDFQCPFCAKGLDTLLQLHEEYSPDDLRIVVKHLPLDFHPDALPAAVAAQAVRDAGGDAAFFSYARTLMANQRSLSPQSLADWAVEAGVERDLYNDGVGTEMTIRRVAEDAKLAARLGVNGTPAFFVNGVSVNGAQPIDYFRALIDAEKAAFEQQLERDGAWDKAYQARLIENMRGSLARRLLADDPETYAVPIAGSPTLGPADALVTVVEFTDFECPYCKKAQPTVERLLQDYPGQVRLVFKHLPLPFHRRAMPAARLAAAAYERLGAEAFWKLERSLFESADLSSETLTTLGAAAGLKPAEVQAALEAEGPSPSVERDLLLSQDVNANGTPHFFINGKRLTGAQPYEAFTAIVDAELEEARALVAGGTAPADLYVNVVQRGISPGAPQKLADVLGHAPPRVPTQGRPSRGAANAPVVLHVFSDFQCPYCRRAELTVAELESTFGEQLRVIWHNLPLPFHERARPAARAALEAYAQKGDAGFWAMHDQLFALDRQDQDLSEEALLSYADELSLDGDRFKAALTDQRHDAAIATDEELAESLQIRGTPGFIIGDYIVSGARPVGHFERVIRQALKDSGKGR